MAEEPDSPPAGAATPAGSATEPDGDHAESRRRRLVAKERDLLSHLFVTLGKVLGVVVTIVTLLGGAVTLLFQVDPTLEPCVGGSGASFTSVQVVPKYPLEQYVQDELGYVPTEQPAVRGAEVRYTFQTSNLKSNGVVLYGTLVQVAGNGDVTFPPIDTGDWGLDEDLIPQRRFPTLAKAPPKVTTPNRCSQDSSGLYWMVLPPTRRAHRYRIILELYKGKPGVFNDRVGVGETPIFDYP